MSVCFDMFKFPKVEEAWESLEKRFEAQSPDSEIKLICRMTDELMRQGYRIFTTPCFSLSGCEGSQYRSFLISHEEQLSSKVNIAINEFNSFSGDIVFRKWLKNQNLEPQDEIESRSHLNSVKALLAKEINLASVDCISWAYIQQELPESKNLHILGQTPLTDGHPIVIRSQNQKFQKQLLDIKSETLEKLYISDFC